jgi:sporulation protein YlmC with PRC-barrel domain
VKLTDILGCRVEDTDGKRIGHVFDIRVARRKGSSRRRADQQWRVVGILTGNRGLTERLGVFRARGRSPTHDVEVIPWEAIKRIRDGVIVVDDQELQTVER